jgi:hypothetical protein
MIELCHAPLLSPRQFRSIEIKLMHVSPSTPHTVSCRVIDLSLLQILEWNLTPPTCIDFLCFYLQNASNYNPELFGNRSNKATYPPCTRWTFRRDLFGDAMDIIDVFVHFPASLWFSPSRNAASALFHACQYFVDDNRLSLIGE